MLNHHSNSGVSFGVTVNQTLIGFLLGIGVTTITVLGIQNITLNNQQSSNVQNQTQMVSCPSVEQQASNMDSAD